MGRKLDDKKMLDDSTKFFQSKNCIAPKSSNSIQPWWLGSLERQLLSMWLSLATGGSNPAKAKHGTVAVKQKMLTR